jgi:hypothetical protein
VTRCSSCGADIRWIVMLSGKRMPVDAQPEKRVVLDDMPEPRGTVADVWVPHWATCPNAAQHRRPRA